MGGQLSGGQLSGGQLSGGSIVEVPYTSVCYVHCALLIKRIVCKL